MPTAYLAHDVTVAIKPRPTALATAAITPHATFTVHITSTERGSANSNASGNAGSVSAATAAAAQNFLAGMLVKVPRRGRAVWLRVLRRDAAAGALLVRLELVNRWVWAGAYPLSPMLAGTSCSNSSCNSSLAVCEPLGLGWCVSMKTSACFAILLLCSRGVPERLHCKRYSQPASTSPAMLMHLVSRSAGALRMAPSRASLSMVVSCIELPSLESLCVAFPITAW